MTHNQELLRLKAETAMLIGEKLRKSLCCLLHILTKPNVQVMLSGHTISAR